MSRCPSMTVDLHCHSNVSDRVLAPAALAKYPHQAAADLGAPPAHAARGGIARPTPAAGRCGPRRVRGEGGGVRGPTDTGTALAGLARATHTVRLGTLVTSATFRHPGLLAVQVAQVDQMSGGRVELGLGAGWSEREHAAYGIPFPESVGERFDRLESSWPSSPGSGRHPSSSVSLMRAGTTRWSTHLRFRSRCRHRCRL